MSFIQKIKEDNTKYCIENLAVLPFNKEFEAMKKELSIKSFYDLPESYQKKVKSFLKRMNHEKVFLVGSLASGSGIIPNVTPVKFIELRKTSSYKTRKEKSDIDLHVINKSGLVVLKKTKSIVVNIESLPVIFEPSVLIYENGEYL